MSTILLEPPDPVTVDHKYGSTVVPADPRRVVSAGFTDHDALLALGVVPDDGRLNAWTGCRLSERRRTRASWSSSGSTLLPHCTKCAGQRWRR